MTEVKDDNIIGVGNTDDITTDEPTFVAMTTGTDVVITFSAVELNTMRPSEVCNTEAITLGEENCPLIVLPTTELDDSSCEA